MLYVKYVHVYAFDKNAQCHRHAYKVIDTRQMIYTLYNRLVNSTRRTLYFSSILHVHDYDKV